MKAKQLIDNEYVLLEIKKHGSNLLKAFCKFVVGALVLVMIHGLLVRNYYYVVRHSNDSVFLFPAQEWLSDNFDLIQLVLWAWGLILAGIMTYNIVRWNNFRYIITNQRILRSQGVFRKIRQLLIYDVSRITPKDVTVRKTFMQRCVRSGDVVIRAPNSLNPVTGSWVNAEYAILKNIPRASKVAAIILNENDGQVH